MGRIQDAMAKLEGKGKEDASPLMEATHNDQNWKSNGRGILSEALPESNFDFMSYALNPALAEVGTDQAPLLEERRRFTPDLVPEVELDAARLDPHLVMLSDYDPAAAEQYQRVASCLIAAAIERPLKRLLIVSALHGDGRTCVLLNLASALARVQRRVLVIDTDLLRPSASRLLGLEVEAGLTEVFADEALIDDAIRKVRPGGFDLLPARGQPENAAELLTSPKFERLLDELDGEYDFVLFDSAPLLTSDDAFLLLRHVDAALVVVAQGRCTSEQGRRAVARIAREDIFGIVMNRLC